MHNMLSWKATVLQQHSAKFYISPLVWSWDNERKHTNLIVAPIPRRAGFELRNLVSKIVQRNVRIMLILLRQQHTHNRCCRSGVTSGKLCLLDSFQHQLCWIRIRRKVRPICQTIRSELTWAFSNDARVPVQLRACTGGIASPWTRHQEPWVKKESHWYCTQTIH